MNINVRQPRYRIWNADTFEVVARNWNREDILNEFGVSLVKFQRDMAEYGECSVDNLVIELDR